MKKEVSEKLILFDLLYICSKTVEILYAKPPVVCSGDHDPRALVKHIKSVKFLKSTR